ncbi:hypothetical protein JOB18_003585 [Solea senegalensis]|uniref:Uncharacterized protein n=1 Tax=Solea senegalensis TaxID=28829 RepID=A0AAV6QG04_SOLSE|nr:hypothetical protein JOB18_003585 [Solea senegalensis]
MKSEAVKNVKRKESHERLQSRAVPSRAEPSRAGLEKQQAFQNKGRLLHTRLHKPHRDFSSASQIKPWLREAALVRCRCLG